LWVLNYAFGEPVTSISKIEVKMEISDFSETSIITHTIAGYYKCTIFQSKMWRNSMCKKKETKDFLEVSVSWDVRPYSLVDRYRRFRGTFSFYREKRRESLEG
jgi:hypothetical protein